MQGNMPPSLIRQHAAMQRARRRAEHIPDMDFERCLAWAWLEVER